MGKINVLSFAVANLIAAGEVVDRPASVIKELVENSIDAGATRVTVEIQNGGVTLMRVTDNGSGISREDLPVAVRRHATSKIKDETDLNAIITLGFRGEALAAIAAVSDVRIISKTADQSVGAMLEVSGGVTIGIGDRAAQNGTTVFVENLFANVPARRKFLKKDMTEAMAVTAVVEKIALSHPEIAFRLICDGNTRLETAGDGQLKSAVYAIFGREFTKSLIEVDSSTEGIRLSGFIGRTDNCKVNRNFQNFFINGRYVKSRTAQAAIEQAYVSYIPQERFPVCVLNITINPALVDVNVHPSKLEVKFSNEKPVFEAVYYGVRSALEQNVTRPELKLPGQPAQGSVRAEVGGRRLSDVTEPLPDRRDGSVKSRQLSYDIYTPKKTDEVKPPEPAQARASTPVRETAVPFAAPPSSPVQPTVKEHSEGSGQPKTQVPAPIPEQPPMPSTVLHTVPEPAVIGAKEQSSDWRFVGEVFNSYLIVEKGEKLILIDKHAAHERIIFERLKANMKSTGLCSQILMLPVERMILSSEAQILEQYRAEIESTGFSFTTGRCNVSITAIPDGISTDAAADMIAEMAGRLLGDTGTPGITKDTVFEKALYQASCKAAIKAGREYPEGNSAAIVAELMRLPDITFCPHGRPVALEMTKHTLDHQFERS